MSESLFKNKYLGILILLAGFCLQAHSRKLVILHTNDTHSQVEASVVNADTLGGLVQRAALIDSIRQANEDVLLLDAGDFSQGSPYYNFFHGRMEVAAINLLKYDAITLGNHEFDNGVDSLAMLANLLKAPIVCSNYQIIHPELRGYVQASLVIEKNGLRIGIIGVGVNPDGLISKKNFKGIVYKDPISEANHYAELLKKQEHCELVICLSHLGDDSPNVNDSILAMQSRNIDLIIGGHTHKLIDRIEIKNLDNQNVLISQAGKYGTYLGVIELDIE